jgi:hypothetical protein
MAEAGPETYFPDSPTHLSSWTEHSVSTLRMTEDQLHASSEENVSVSSVCWGRWEVRDRWIWVGCDSVRVQGVGFVRLKIRRGAKEGVVGEGSLYTYRDESVRRRRKLE